MSANRSWISVIIDRADESVPEELNVRKAPMLGEDGARHDHHVDLASPQTLGIVVAGRHKPDRDAGRMHGVTEEDYGHLVAALLPALRSSDGFISHAAGPFDGGYRVTELWEPAEAHRAWFEGHVRPLLAPDATPPTITTQPITTIATRD